MLVRKLASTEIVEKWLKTTTKTENTRSHKENEIGETTKDLRFLDIWVLNHIWMLLFNLPFIF